MEKENDKWMLCLLGGILFLAVAFECIILGVAFFGADTVECNMLWCTFTTTKGDFAQTCSQNGFIVDCDELGLNNPFGTGTPFTIQDWERHCSKQNAKVITVNNQSIDCTGNFVRWE